MAQRIAVYPGSFDPPTYGHIDLIERAAKIFDTLVVAVARNSDKASLFSVEERIEMLASIVKPHGNVEVTSFQGLTAEFARQRNAIALVRGLRVVSDFEYEITMAIANQKLNPTIDTVCLMPSERFLLLSSRIVREIAVHGGSLKEFVPEEIEHRLIEKLGRNGA
ncbi:MAG: pantetheine-phosphate adenylyltransferase [Candidatus Hydrogenedentes bacterium]|nr:pantetheine-phosphate adenylyltransferase [Candidatus Hydrogenedentota bacterium]